MLNFALRARACYILFIFTPQGELLSPYTGILLPSLISSLVSVAYHTFHKALGYVPTLSIRKLMGKLFHGNTHTHTHTHTHTEISLISSHHRSQKNILAECFSKLMQDNVLPNAKIVKGTGALCVEHHAHTDLTRFPGISSLSFLKTYGLSQSLNHYRYLCYRLWMSLLLILNRFSVQQCGTSSHCYALHGELLEDLSGYE